MTSKQLEKAAAEMNLPAWDSVADLAEAQMETNNGTYYFPDAIERRDVLKTEIEQMTAELKEINDQLLVAARASEITKVTLWAGMTFEIRNGRSASKLQPTKLLEQGVTIEQIQAATEEGTPYQYVQVNKPKPPKAG